MIEGMIKNEIEKKAAQQIWEWVLPFARYGFNRSHSAAYGLIAYQTAFLKAHFPVEFMASLLTSEKVDVERIGFLIGEGKRMGIEVLPPDLNESLENFTVVGPNKIRFGLLAIKNVGYNVVEIIIRERKARGPYHSITDFLNRFSSRDLNKKSFESLIKAGVFDKLAERSQLLSNLDRLLEATRETQRIKVGGQRGLFDGMEKISEIKLLPAKPATAREKLTWEKELLGLFVTSHPLEDYKKILETKSFGVSKVKAAFTNFIDRQIKLGGLISSIKKIITRNGKPMLFMNLEDLDDKIEVVVFPSIIEKNPSVFQENKIVLVSGRLDNKDGVPKIICQEIEEVVES